MGRDDIRFQSDTLEWLQRAAEDYMVEVFKDAAKLRGNRTVSVKHWYRVLLARRDPFISRNRVTRWLREFEAQDEAAQSSEEDEAIVTVNEKKTERKSRRCNKIVPTRSQPRRAAANVVSYSEQDYYAAILKSLN
jgi:hypothetical protein